MGLDLRFGRVGLLPHSGGHQVRKNASFLLDRVRGTLLGEQRKLNGRPSRGLRTLIRPDKALDGRGGGGKARALDLDEKGLGLLFHRKVEIVST